MSKYQSTRRRKFDTLQRHLARYPTEHVRSYACIAQYPRTLRAAAIAVLRMRDSI